MDTICAQCIDEQSKYNYTLRRFREWVDGSLLFFPLLFILGAIILVVFARNVDQDLIAQANLSD